MDGSENLNDVTLSTVIMIRRKQDNRNNNYGDDGCNDGKNIGSQSTAAELHGSVDISLILPVHCL